jgi:hypothetical protein
MNWQTLTPLLEKTIEEVMKIKDVDERLAVLIFMVAEKVESAERESCAKLVEAYIVPGMANEMARIIRARGQE